MSQNQIPPNFNPQGNNEPLPFQDKKEKIAPLTSHESTQTPEKPTDPTERLKKVLSGKRGKVKHQFRPGKPAIPFPSLESPHPDERSEQGDLSFHKNIAQAAKFPKKIMSERFILRVAHEIQTASRINSIRLLFLGCIVVAAYIGYKVGIQSVKREAENKQRATLVQPIIPQATVEETPQAVQDNSSVP